MKADAKELRCINIARFNRREAAALALKLRSGENQGFGSYLKTLTLFRHGFDNATSVLRTLAAMPLSILSYLAAPYGYHGYRKSRRERDWQLQMIVKEYNHPVAGAQAPEEKRLLPLWKIHGLTNEDFRPEDLFLTLNAWVGVLYGPSTGKEIGLALRFAQNMKRSRLTESVRPHDAAREFVAQISRELPPYKISLHRAYGPAEECSPETDQRAIVDAPRDSSDETGGGDLVMVHTFHPEQGIRSCRLRLGADIDRAVRALP